MARFQGGALYCIKHYLQMYNHGVCCDEKKRRYENKIIHGILESKIVTSSGEQIIVDTEMIPILSEHTWCLNAAGYAVSRTKGKYVRLNRLILACEPEFVVDHINGNKLDNRKTNLRKCKPIENSRNKGLGRNNQTGVAGVSKRADGKWRVRIMVGRTEKALGVYDSFEKAVNVRREAEKIHFGEYSPGRRFDHA
ncbi:MAG: HNH endonuclease [Candidatus Limiplasma sp.]|nr:HNH endonuclease [Candidatus Limiplasma sp.]